MSFIGDMFGGGGGNQPAGSTNVTTSAEINPTIKPFIGEILGKAQEQFQTEEFQTFPGPRLAEFDPTQQQAFEGIQSLVGSGLGGTPAIGGSAQLAQKAQDALAQGTQQVDITDIERLSNPYQQAVIDIQKREALRDFEGSTLPQIGAQAAGSGAFGGSRQAVLESEARRNLDQRLADIQATGSQQAYNQALAEFGKERARQQAGAGIYGQFAQQFPQQAFKELGALQAVGETKQSRDQRALDIALSDFLSEQQFPGQQLARYAGLVRGFPIDPTISRQEVMSMPTPSLGQQLLGIAGTGLQTAALAGAFGAGGGRVGSLPVRMNSGGQIQGGLAGLERHQDIRRNPTYGRMSPIANMLLQLERQNQANTPELSIEELLALPAEDVGEMVDAYQETIESRKRGRQDFDRLDDVHNELARIGFVGEESQTGGPRPQDTQRVVESQEDIMDSGMLFGKGTSGPRGRRQVDLIAGGESPISYRSGVDGLLDNIRDFARMEELMKGAESYQVRMPDIEEMVEGRAVTSRPGTITEEMETAIIKGQGPGDRSPFHREMRYDPVPGNITDVPDREESKYQTGANLIRELRRGVRPQAPRLDEFIPRGPGGAGTRISQDIPRPVRKPDSRFIPRGPGGEGTRIPQEMVRGRAAFDELSEMVRGRAVSPQDDPQEMVRGRAAFDELSEMVRGRAVSPQDEFIPGSGVRRGVSKRYPARTFEESLQEFEVAPDAPGGGTYSDAEITAIMEEANPGRGRRGHGALPAELRGKSSAELRNILKMLYPNRNEGGLIRGRMSPRTKRSRRASGGQIRGGLSDLERHQDNQQWQAITENDLRAELKNKGMGEVDIEERVKWWKESGGQDPRGSREISDSQLHRSKRTRDWLEASDPFGSGHISSGYRILGGHGKKGLEGFGNIPVDNLDTTRKKLLDQMTQDNVGKNLMRELQSGIRSTDKGLVAPKIDPVGDTPDSTTSNVRGVLDLLRESEKFGKESKRIAEEKSEAEKARKTNIEKARTEGLGLLTDIRDRGLEDVVSGRKNFKDLMDNRTSTLTEIFNEGMNNIESIKDETQKGIAKERVNNVWGFVGSVLAGQVDHPGQMLAGIAKAGNERFGEAALRKSKLNKEERELVKETKRLAGEARAEYLKQGLQTDVLLHNEYRRLDKEKTTLENNLVTGKIALNTQADRDKHMAHIASLKAEQEGIVAGRTVLSDQLAIFDQANKILDDAATRAIREGELTQDQYKLNRQLNNDSDLDSVDLKLMSNILGSRFGADSILETNHISGDFVMKGGENSPTFNAYTEVATAAQQFKRLQKLGKLEEDLSYEIPLKDRTITIIPGMTMAQVIDQVLTPYLNKTNLVAKAES